MVLAEFGNGQVFWSLVWFAFFFIWVWLLVVVFADIVRSQDLSGWGKAFWTILLIVMPYLGAFVYVIARGSGMSERKMHEERAREEMRRRYMREAAKQPTDVDQLAKLATLRAEGVIDAEEYARMKSKVTTA